MKNFKILLLLILMILICILSYLILSFRTNYKIKRDFEEETAKIAIQNSKTVFSIDKVVFFSTCSAKSKIANNSNIIIENLYQYTDIALYLNNNLDATGIFTNKNTLKEVYIDNFEFVERPSVGTPSFYFKEINNFTKDNFSDKNLINDTLSFEITSDNETDFSTPILFNNCANPITISYLNNNIKTDYGIENSTGITYNGSLLNECFVTLTSLSSTVKFDIHIVNNLDEEFICNVYFDIPLSSEDNSLTDGTFTVEKVTVFKFNKVIKK